jgi:hypothetical protein
MKASVTMISLVVIATFGFIKPDLRYLDNQGPPGKEGPPGKNGKDGEKGKDGLPGKDGLQGKEGAVGKSGNSGEKGKDGSQGPPGINGINGKDCDLSVINTLIQQVNNLQKQIIALQGNTIQPSIQSLGKINVTIDNAILSINVNDKPVELTVPNLDSWYNVKSIPLQIGYGDVISIKGRNDGGPAGIIATITFKDEKKNDVIINTGTDWKCDGTNAMGQGLNGVGPWGIQAGIDAKANWIWNQDLRDISTCSVTLKKP